MRKTRGTRFFYNSIFGEWMTIIACGDLSIEEWYRLMRRCGICTAMVREEGSKKAPG